ncbi:hypothetical protein DFJ73DRAFT_855840 [Zopfochytrium polystomum]|nr:hypothetical protein DFJ73DRAFT_855840 [Zopfochytrium polystomum]
MDAVPIAGAALSLPPAACASASAALAAASRASTANARACSAGTSRAPTPANTAPHRAASATSATALRYTAMRRSPSSIADTATTDGRQSPGSVCLSPHSPRCRADAGAVRICCRWWEGRRAKAGARGRGIDVPAAAYAGAESASVERRG